MGEQILVYLGPSLELEEAKKILPEAIYRPPAAQSDILSDAVELSPTHILLIDGVFHQALSVWPKEIVFCLSRGIKVYGSSSMGALRAADLADVGMIGYGKIYEYYRSGKTGDDSEVAVSFTESPRTCTIPLINVRIALDGKDASNRILGRLNAIHYSNRHLRDVNHILQEYALHDIEIIDYKREDAIGLLKNFRSLGSEVDGLPTKEHLNHLFWAQYERDRKVNGTCLQHIEAHHLLNNPRYSEDLWDANNRSIALALADQLHIQAAREEVISELNRFVFRNKIENLKEWFQLNHLSDHDGIEFLKENARIRKIHKALDSTRMRRRGTKSLLDHLRTHNRYSSETKGVKPEDDITLGFKSFNPKEVDAYLLDRGIRVEGTTDEFLSETGFGTYAELCAAIEKERLWDGN